MGEEPGYRLLQVGEEPGYRLLQMGEEPGYRLLQVGEEPGYRLLQMGEEPGYRLLQVGEEPGYRPLQVIDCFRWVRNQVIDRFLALCSSEGEPLLQKLKPDLTKHREDMVYRICFLVPPSCSTVLVSDWCVFVVMRGAALLWETHSRRLETREEEIKQHLEDLRRSQQRNTQVSPSQVILSQVSPSQVILSQVRPSQVSPSQVILSQVRPSQVSPSQVNPSQVSPSQVSPSQVNPSQVSPSQVSPSQVNPSQVSPSQVNPSQVNPSQVSPSQRRKVHLDDLLGALRQGSSEDNLRTNLERCVLYLQDVKHRYCSAHANANAKCVQYLQDVKHSAHANAKGSGEGEVLERLPPLLLEELLSYSSSISSFFHLGHTYKLSPAELQTLLPSSSAPPTPEANDGAETTKPENHPISDQNDTDPAQPSQDWLTEADSSLIDFCDISSFVTFTSARGVAYSGPAFRCPAPDLQQETQLSLFPAELLTHALSRYTHTHTHTHSVLIQQVDAHCEEVEEVLSSCRVELQELQSSVRRRNQQLSVRLSNMEEHVLSADSSSR
ncbi:Transmembrane protease serine 13 [Dissostichus eleginoides]|uniref:Transmembrane protease serine 13 n=1 Tax=Dissostichus eleginoides TaxID=100907 RepID=A0AAD9C168_DISEL|nr:Transmembrane protease serine 13 [Dissostichus eleginoides]